MSVVKKLFGMEMDLLLLVLKQMNMSFIHVPTTKDSEVEENVTDNLINALIAKKTFIALALLEQIFCWSHCWTPPVLISPLVSAGMYCFLTNIEDGAASIEYCLWNCG